MNKYSKQFDSIPRGTYPTIASHKIENKEERDKNLHRIDYIFANTELAKYVTKSDYRLGSPHFSIMFSSAACKKY